MMFKKRIKQRLTDGMEAVFRVSCRGMTAPEKHYFCVWEKLATEPIFV